MRRRLIMSGLLVASIILVGLGESGLARERAVCEESPTPMAGMNGITGPGMMGTPGMHGDRMGMHMGFSDRPVTLMLEKQNDLKLTSEQVARLETLRGSFEKKADEGLRTLRERYGELREILGEDKVDLDEAEATLKSIAELRTDLALERIRVIEEGKSALTAEQWTTLKELRGGEDCPGMKT